MSNRPFPGFPAKQSFTPLPNLFFARLLPEIDNLAELKLIVHVFWRLYQKRGALKFVTRRELAADKPLMEGLAASGDGAEVLGHALAAAVERGVLLHLRVENGGREEDVYLVNTEANRAAVFRLQNGEMSLGALPELQPYVKADRPNIFTLYEQNVGLLTPMIADELREAEQLYPASWIEDAFREAVSLNKRSWRYVSRILERWASEGKQDGESGRDSKKRKDPGRYVKGKYGHVVVR